MLDFFFSHVFGSRSLIAERCKPPIIDRRERETDRKTAETPRASEDERRSKKKTKKNARKDGNNECVRSSDETFGLLRYDASLDSGSDED